MIENDVKIFSLFEKQRLLDYGRNYYKKSFTIIFRVHHFFISIVCSKIRFLSFEIYVYVYIYIYREREREIDR